MIEREIAFDMQSFIASVNEFLAFRKYDILEGKGSVSRKTAESKAFSEYNEFNKTQKINSDFVRPPMQAQQRNYSQYPKAPAVRTTINAPKFKNRKQIKLFVLPNAEF